MNPQSQPRLPPKLTQSIKKIQIKIDSKRQGDPQTAVEVKRKDSYKKEHSVVKQDQRSRVSDPELIS